jgi:hypothetical protein
MADATWMRKRAERRLGQVMAEDRKAGRLVKGAPGPGRGKKGKKAESQTRLYGRSPSRASTSPSPTAHARRRRCPRTSLRHRSRGP